MLVPGKLIFENLITGAGKVSIEVIAILSGGVKLPIVESILVLVITVFSK